MSAGKIFKESLIKSVAAGDESALLYFDRQGLLPAPGEDAPAFAEKLTRLAAALAELDSELKKDRPFGAAPGIRISRAASTIMMSFRYKWPPGTGTPKELKTMFTAISRAVVVSLTVTIRFMPRFLPARFSVWFIVLPPPLFAALQNFNRRI